MPVPSLSRIAVACATAIAVLALLPASSLHADEPVVWTNIVGASASGNTLTKTGTATAWDAGAASTNLIRDGYGYVEFTMTETTRRVMAGLSNGDSGTDASDVDYAIHPGDGNLHILEAGVYRGQFGTYTAGDRFRIEVRYGVVRYLKNGGLVYTSTVPPKYPLRVDAELYEPGVSITNVRVGNIVWANETGISVAGSTITKSGAAGWTSGAISATTIEAADGAMEFTTTETNTTRVAGLSKGDSSQAWQDVDFGIEVRDDATIEVVEAGTSRGTFGAYGAGDRFRVEVRDGVVGYYRNGGLFYTSTVAPAYPLRIDTALYSAGATLTDLSLTPLVWTSASGVTVAENSLAKTAAEGWNAVAKTSFSLTSGDGYLEFKAIETDKRRAVGLRSGTGTATTYADLSYAIDLGATGIVTVYESGVSRGTFGSYAHGDRFRIEIEEGVVRYRKNGAVVYSSTVSPIYPIHGEATLYSANAAVTDVLAGTESWLSPVGVEAMGSSFAKTGTVEAWDAEALSTRAFDTGAIEFTASQTDRWRHVGLTHGDNGTDAFDLDFAIHLNQLAQIHVFQGSSYAGYFGNYAAGDRFRVEVASGVVRYLRNGSVFYTSTVTPTLPLRADVNIYSPGASVLNVHVEGNAVVDTLEAPAFSPGTGTYSAAQTVTITTLPGATIRYTSDGTDPTTSSTAYTGALTVGQNTTLKAKAWKTGYLASTVATATYELKVPTPTLAPGGGTYSTPQSVVVSESLAGADIHYTTNGVDPTQSDTAIASGGSIPVDMPTTLKVAAWKAGWTRSDVAGASYTFVVATPTLTPAAGTYVGTLPVTLATTTPGATLRYRLDGATPSASDPGVASGGSVTLDRSATLKVVGFRTGWNSSATAVGTYWISLGTTAAPTMTPPPGTFTSGQVVTISTTTSGAVIRFTLDGIEPTFRSPVYAAPVRVTATTHLRAKAFHTDMTPSAPAGGLYIIAVGTVDSPRFSPGTGIYTTYQDVRVDSETIGATIHYTTNGAEPTESDPVVTSGTTVRVDHSTTLKAKAWKAGVTPSAARWASYQLTGAVATGSNHTVALKVDGSLWSWGFNDWAQLGDPSLAIGATRAAPGPVAGLTDVVDVACGDDFCFALKRDRTLWSWGHSSLGSLGDGNWCGYPSQCVFPQVRQVVNLTNIVAISAGEGSAAAVKADGSVWIWGAGIVNNWAPVQVAGLAGATAVSVTRHTLALKTDGMPSGTVWSWGVNDGWLLLGDGGGVSGRTEPGLVPGITNATRVASGFYHSLVTTLDRRMYAWGENTGRRLGDGTIISTTLPISIGIGPVASIGAFKSHSAILSPNGRVLTWGVSEWSVLGNGDGTTRDVPAPSLMTGAVAMAGSPTGFHMIALKADGTAWTWGKGDRGQLGNGGYASSSVPVQVTGFQTGSGAPPQDDPDGDGISTLDEMALGTDPSNADTNGDGIPDGVARDAGLSPTNLDMDGDGVTNAVERERGTDPFRADTDGDGVADGTDCFPLDRSRWLCPSPDPTDHTPPIITLTEPTGASLISSIPPQ